jgi:hypothetical protein
MVSSIIALVTLNHTPALGQAEFEPVVSPSGAITEIRLGGDVVAAQLGLMIPKPGWEGRWAIQSGADPALFRTQAENGRALVEGQLSTGDGPIHLRQLVEHTDQGIAIHYALRPTADLSAESVFITASLGTTELAGVGKWYASDGLDLRSEPFPAELPDPYHILGGTMEWVGWTLPSGRGIRFQLTGRGLGALNLQDNRQFSIPRFELQLPVADTKRLRAGQEVEFDLLLQPFTVQQAQQEEAEQMAAREAEIVPLESDGPLRIAELQAPEQPIAQFSTLELTLDLDAAYGNPFDPNQVTVEGVFRCPDGRRMRVPGFLYVPYERLDRNGKERLRKAGDPVWKVRFAPPLPGDYGCVVRAADRTGTVRTKPMRFEVQPSGAPGFVRRSTESPYYLRFDSGDPYFAVGENVCWAQDAQTLAYDEWFSALGADGGNYARIWLVRWNMALEWIENDPRGRGTYYGLGRYSLDNAWRLDRVMDVAREHGIYVMLCLGYHGELMDREGYFGEQCWDQNPYNAANGGPCERPDEFWTSPEARELYKHRLRYYVARWGHSRNVLSFEFWNEVVAPADWVAEMAAYLRSIDPQKHLITTTYGYDDVWRIPEIDYTQSHTYGTEDRRHDCVAEISRLCREHTEKYAKPHLVGEFGIDWQTGDSRHDPEGHGTNLHNGLWSALASRSMGGAMVWYWDGYVHPLNLYREFNALQRFVNDVPWHELSFRLADLTTPEREPETGEPWGDLTVKPGIGWGRATGVEFSVSPQGRLLGGGQFSSYLYAPSKPDERRPLRFRVACPAGGQLVLHVGEVSVRALLQVLIDGEVAWENEFQAGPPGEGEYKETNWREEYGLWQSLYDADYTIDIPRGRHTLALRNVGDDWIEVNQYAFRGCLDPRFDTPLEVLGLQTDRYAILWLHNRASNWYNRSHELPIEPATGTCFWLKGLDSGDYEIVWYDTKTGLRTARESVTCARRLLFIEPPEVEADIACRIRRK